MKYLLKLFIFEDPDFFTVLLLYYLRHIPFPLQCYLNVKGLKCVKFLSKALGNSNSTRMHPLRKTFRDFDFPFPKYIREFEYRIISIFCSRSILWFIAKNVKKLPDSDLDLLIQKLVWRCLFTKRLVTKQPFCLSILQMGLADLSLRTLRMLISPLRLSLFSPLNSGTVLEKKSGKISNVKTANTKYHFDFPIF